MRDSYAEAGGRGLAVLRILTGALLLHYGIPKLTAHFAVELPSALTSFAMSNPHAWYREFLLTVAIPHAGLFAALVMLGELVLGACFVLGIGVGLAGPFAAVMFVNYFLATGHFDPASAWGNLFLAAVSLVCSMFYAGCTWGADASLRRSMPMRALYPLGVAARWRL